MNLLVKNEKTLVKSLVYGLLGGLYFSILFISRTEEIAVQRNMRTYQELSIFEYIIKVLQTSIIISVATFIVVLLSLYIKSKKQSSE